MLATADARSRIVHTGIAQLVAESGKGVHDAVSMLRGRDYPLLAEKARVLRDAWARGRALHHEALKAVLAEEGRDARSLVETAAAFDRIHETVRYCARVGARLECLAVKHQ